MTGFPGPRPRLISPTASSGSRSWAAPPTTGPTARAAPPSPIGPGTARGGEKISRKRMVLSCNQPDMDDCVACENQEEEAEAMIEESASGDEAVDGNESSWNMDCSTVVKVKTLHISSPILAAKSPFFYKLFSNGMKESEQRHVTLRINASGRTRHHLPFALIFLSAETICAFFWFSLPSLSPSLFLAVNCLCDAEIEDVNYVLSASLSLAHSCDVYSCSFVQWNDLLSSFISHGTEEAALMELLNFMYSNSLSTTSATGLLDVLMAADKFEVASCMRYCSRVLRNMPMTPESALLYLDLPSSVLMGEAVQPLTDTAKQFLADRYKDMTKYQEEVMALPLAGIEAILSSNDLQVASEDAVYDFVLKWARAQYPRIDERREILGARLARFIRFPYMTCRKLKKVLSCTDFDHDVASKLVLEALFFKGEPPHRQRILAAEESASLTRRFVERAYKYRPVKVVEFELPRQQCVVYLDLKREECANLFPSGRVYSQAFHLGGQGFFLSAHCNMDQQSSFHCFGLFLGMQEKGSVSFAVDYEFAARSKPTEEFVSKYKGNYTFTGGKAVGYRNLFALPWTSFMAEDSLYFINGVLHLRAELTIKH
ncbi:Boi protein [Turnera subulata]|uniref:Boi protein n=1 Tax=Turnera subulata TaxID=218843 RepID=A0A9Q0J045_9ROSI|nr:Boi protein [Turnera subulata]